MLRWFWDLSMAKKVALLNSIVVLFVLASLIFSNYSTRSMADNFRRFVDREQALAFALNEIYALGLQCEQATRNVLLDPSDIEAVQNYQKAIQELKNVYDGALQLVPSGSSLHRELERAWPIWNEGAELKTRIQTLSREGKQLEALRTLKQEETPKWREFKDIILSLSQTVKRTMIVERAQVDNYTHEVLLKSSAIALCAFAIIVLAGIILVKVVTKPLRKIAEVLSSITAGDLTARSEIDSRDEMGMFSCSVNEMAETLRRVLENVTQHVSLVAASSSQLFSTSARIATGTNELSSQTNSVATASEEISATSAEIANNCLSSAKEASNATATAQKGTEVVQQTIVGMNRIADRVGKSAQTINALGERSNQIGKVVGTIGDIAKQTNLLALNAAVEAARAGQHGRGFAVVAEEVRALAGRTTNATAEISAMIVAIQQESMDAVASMEEGVAEVEAGTVEAEKSGNALKEILNQINALSIQINQIATAAREQMATFNGISESILQIREVVAISATGAHDARGAASELSKMSDELRQIVTRFKIVG